MPPFVLTHPCSRWCIAAVRAYAVYLIPQDVRQDGAGLLQFIQENRLDAVDCVPSQLKLLLDAGLLESRWLGAGDYAAWWRGDQ